MYALVYPFGPSAAVMVTNVVHCCCHSRVLLPMPTAATQSSLRAL